MVNVQDDALLILRHMLEHPFGTDFNLNKLAALVALPSPEFDAANLFLVRSGYVDGGGGRRWVTPAGVAWHAEEMRKRFDLGILAERLLRTVMEVETEQPRSSFIYRRTIQGRLAIDDASYFVAVRELADAQLVVESDFDFLASTPLGRKALRHGFRRETPEPNSTVNVGNVIGTMLGGNVQGIGQASQSEITQIANDPQALAEMLDKLVTQLIDAVKSELPAQQLVAYKQGTEELKTELKAEKPQPAVVKKLLGTLAFLGDIEGTVGLAGRVWQLVGPLVPLALAVLQNAAK